MSNDPPARAGRTPSLAIGLVAVALVALLAAFLLLAKRREGPAGTSANGAAPVAARTDAELASAHESSNAERALSAPAAVANDGLLVQPNVRLSGPGKLSGRVLDRSSGAPVAGAKVELLPLPPAGQEFFARALRLSKTGDTFASRVKSIAVAASEPDGSFEFVGVRCGTYFVQARGARSVPDSIARAEVAASGAGGPIELWVRPGGRVLGSVLGPDGKPIGGAKIALTLGPSNFLESLRSGDATYLEALSDDAGHFTIAGVPPSRGYDVTASGAGFALSHALDVDVRAGEDTQVVVHARWGGSVEGRVVTRETNDKGESGAAVPLANAHVAVVPRGLRDLQFAEELLHQTHSITDANGRFHIENVPSGEFDLVGVADRHLPAKGPRVLVAEDGTSRASDFELPRGPMVSGRVVDGSGAPIEGVHVRWNSVDFRNFDFDFSFAPLLAAAVEGFDYPSTDADGRFTAGAFAGEPPHRLDCFKMGFQPAQHRWDPSTEKGEITITMLRGGAIEGIVMDAVRHVPVTSFTIETHDRVETQLDAPGNQNPFSGGILVENEQGKFALDPMKSSDSVALTFRAKGYLERTLDDLKVVEGETLRGVIVELTPGGTIKGEVVDPDGHAVAGALVFAVPADKASAFDRRGNRRELPEIEQLPPGFRDFAAQLGLLGDRAVPTKPDGSFELTGLEAGSKVVLASHRDYVIGKSAPVQVAADVPAEVEIELSKGGGVYGKAVDRFARPVAGAIVLAFSPANFGGEGRSNGGGLYEARTNAVGEYKIDRMVGGGYFVVLTRGDEALNPMSFLGTLNFDMVNVPGDEAVEYDIVDTSSGATRVFGRVLDGERPVARGNISALSFEASNVLGVDLKITQVQELGRYEFVGLAPGEYQFNVDAPGDGRGTVRVNAEIPDVPEFQLDLRYPQGSIEGRVLVAGSHEPVANAEVSVQRVSSNESSGWLGSLLARESGLERRRANEAGEFVVDGLAAGEYVLRVRPPGREKSATGPPLAASEPRKVEVREDAATHGVEVELMPALELAGHVVDGAGKPVGDAVLIATRKDSEGAAPERATSGDDGAFRFAELGAGVYELSATADGYAQTTMKDVKLAPEHVEPLEVVLHDGIAVSVKIVNATGQPVTGATGRLVAPTESQAASGGDFGRAITSLFAGKGVSDAKGILELGTFGPGAYRLQVQRGLERAEDDVTLSGTGPVELRVRLR